MGNYPSFEQLANDTGIKAGRDANFKFRNWIDQKNGFLPLNDAALLTTPNSTIPAEFTSFLSTEVVNILTAPRVATQIFDEVVVGDWTTSYYEWETREFVGETEPYVDNADAGMSDVNRNWQKREQYLFQTNISVGDREAAISSAARLNLIASKQEAAANTIAIDTNRFQMLGVDRMNMYGILNDPNRPAAIMAANNAAGTSTLWADKTMREIYDDVIRLFQELAVNSMGWITQTTPLRLCVSPEANVQFARATDYNTSVMDLVLKYLPNLSVVVVPELHSNTAGETIMMIAPSVNGQVTGRLPVSTRYTAGRVVYGLSHMAQKVHAGVYGFENRIGFSIATMTDI